MGQNHSSIYWPVSMLNGFNLTDFDVERSHPELSLGSRLYGTINRLTNE